MNMKYRDFHAQIACVYVKCNKLNTNQVTWVGTHKSVLCSLKVAESIKQ